MESIELKNRIEKSIKKDNTEKTLIYGEVENGWIVIKHKVEMPESSEEEPTRTCETYVYKEDPLAESKSDEDMMGKGVKDLLDNYM